MRHRNVKQLMQSLHKCWGQDFNPKLIKVYLNLALTNINK